MAAEHHFSFKRKPVLKLYHQNLTNFFCFVTKLPINFYICALIVLHLLNQRVMLSDLFYAIGDIIDYINNYLQFLLLIFTIVVTLFYFMLPYIRPLKSLLKGIGLPYAELYRILFICYKSPRKYIRIYIEMAIIKSKGQHQESQWWKDLRRTFKRFLDDNETSGDYTVQIDTPFDMVTTEFNELVKDYFDYFKQNKTSSRFAIPHNEAVSFITNLEINEGYIVPITFITGLNDRYDEDWVKILSNYFTAFGDDLPPESAILPQELYFTYNWLMWGPSYQIKYGRDTNKLIQYGFGDESNSVNVILKNRDKGAEIWNTFSHEADMSSEKKFGYNCSIKGKLCDTSEYYTYNNEKIDSRSIPFLKRLSSDQLGIPYLLELIDFDIKTNLKAENYFFSAYLWIMFGLNDQNNPGFTPRKSLTFFEHANLADTENYNFLAETLIDKCFRHFEGIALHPQHKVRKYNFCLAMNSYIEKLFLEKLIKMRQGEMGDWFTSNISISTPYSIAEILDTFDNYFITREENYRIIKVSATDKTSIKQLCNFYADMYLDEFGAKNHRLSLDQMLSLLSNSDKNLRFYISLALDCDDQLVGGSIAFFFPEYKCGIIDSIAVHPNHRNHGIGKSLLNYSIQQVRHDTFVNRSFSLEMLLASIPSNKHNKHFSKKCRFWLGNGFIHSEVGSDEFSMMYKLLAENQHNGIDNDQLQKIDNLLINIKKGC
jgi:GNAT superfamily N-acetyltransferase